MRSSASLLLRLSPAIDAMLVAAVFAFLWDGEPADERSQLFINLLMIPFWLWVLTFIGVYESQRVETLTALVRKVLTANAIVFGVVTVTSWPLSGVAGLLLQARVVGVVTLLIVGEKLVVYSALHRLRRRGHDLRWVCIVGAWEWAQDVSARFEQHADWGLRVSCVGIGPASDRLYVRYPHRDVAAKDLSQILSTEVIDEVLIAVRPEELVHEAATLQVCEQMGVMGRVLLDTRGSPDPSRFETAGRDVTIAAGAGPRDEWRLTLKRLIDLTGSIALIVLLLPVLLATALFVKLSSAGPIFFTQARVGLHGRRFRVYKFRTMIEGAEALLPSISARSITKGPTFKDPADFRITPIGRVLRKFSIDELPQLLNVLKGDMSLVGPRPLPVHESVAIEGPYRRRFNMRPGITCLWQINGRSNIDYATWMNYDLQYVDRWSLGLDARLLLKTIPAVLSGRGAC
jgi:exopolysaccharide biosynthesis polyprenyl glycosylphosphotransferase